MDEKVVRRIYETIAKILSARGDFEVTVEYVKRKVE